MDCYSEIAGDLQIKAVAIQEETDIEKLIADVPGRIFRAGMNLISGIDYSGIKNLLFRQGLFGYPEFFFICFIAQRLHMYSNIKDIADP